MRNLSVPGRVASRTTAPGVAPAALAALLLILFGCGQQTPGKAGAAKSAVTDTVAQVETAPVDSPAQQPLVEQTALSSPPSEPAKQAEANPKPAQKLTGAAALERAAAADKYLLILFYRNDDDETREMKEVLASAAAKRAGKANMVTIDVADAAERDIVAKYQVDRAPMPLALVLAPTGAVTGGFPSKVTEEQLSGAFVSPGLAYSLKALQDGKLVLLCFQNASTKSNDAAMRGVNAFKTDVRFAKSTEVVSLNPADAAEAQLLAQLQIDPKTDVAVTALLAPPGSVVAKYNGPTDKEVMIAALAAKQAAGGGG